MNTGPVRRLAILGAFIAATGCVRTPPKGNVVGECPLTESARGYPASASVVRGTVDSTTLARIAHAALAAWDHQDTSWTLPSHVRALWQQVDRPPVHEWGDRRPVPGDTATVVITWARQGLPVATLAGAVAHAPTPFQQRALRVVNHAIDDAMGASAEGHVFPLAIPDDSVSVQIRFGSEPRLGDGVARFAVMYRRVEQGSPRPRPEYPEVARESSVEAVVRVAYIVGPDGRVDTSTVRVVEAPYREFVDAVKSALSRGRWSPLQLDCVAYSAVALQEFNFKLRP